MVGYARWILPAELIALHANAEGEREGRFWADACIPEPTEEQERKFEGLFTEHSTPDGGVLGLRTDGILEFRSRSLEEAEGRVRATNMGKGLFLSTFVSLLPPVQFWRSWMS